MSEVCGLEQQGTERGMSRPGGEGREGEGLSAQRQDGA